MEPKKQFIYEGSRSFLGEVVGYGGAKYVIVPAPLDITTSFLKGTRFGPEAIIKASLSLENYDHEVDYNLRDLAYTMDELEMPPDAKESIGRIKDTVSEIKEDKKIPILLGGEHTVTYGASLALDEKVVFVIFDAHADFKGNLLGVRINHASVSRLISGRNKLMIIGVRSLSLDEKSEAEKRGVDLIFREDMKDMKKIDGLIKKIRGKKVYISIDMDVFDPSIAPGVGTPQPNGLHYEEAFSMLERIIDGSSLVGADVVEVRPMGDDRSTEILSAKLIQDMISMNEKKPS